MPALARELLRADDKSMISVTEYFGDVDQVKEAVVLSLFWNRFV